MRCPQCGTDEDIKWFLRHQKSDENDESNVANAITILCTKCGYNQSFYLSDCLEDIFPEWKEPVFDPSILGALLNNNTYAVNFENTTDEIMEEPATEEE